MLRQRCPAHGAQPRELEPCGRPRYCSRGEVQLGTHSHRGRCWGSRFHRTLPRWPTDCFLISFVIYYAVFGVSWWIGSIAVGALSDWNGPVAGAFGAIALVGAAGVMLAADRAIGRSTK